MSEDIKTTPPPSAPSADKDASEAVTREIGGPKEGDPTRYGDWTVKGRCIDF